MRKPDYILKLKAKEAGDNAHSNKVGCGWTNKADGISIVLDPGVVLDHRLSREYYITLFPNNSNKEE